MPTQAIVEAGLQTSASTSRLWLNGTPQRETVAGDAAARSPTSKIMDIVPLMAMISELGRHSFLLSSSTVFMFSIQMASTGPSRMHLPKHTISDAAR
jgi:hypothetical protein